MNFSKPISINHIVPVTLVLLLTIGVLVPKANGQANVTGKWSTLSYTMPINPVHVALLANGDILVIAGSGNCPPSQTGCPSGAPYGPSNGSGALLLNPVTGSITQFSISWDMFCNGMVLLPDGRAFVMGGTIVYDPFHGQPLTSIFDPASNTFTNGPSMAHGRWYPTGLTLGDGRIFTFSGLDENGATNNTVELYTVNSGWSQEYTTNWSPDLYPRMHLLPNGQVFYSGAIPASALFDLSTGTWIQDIANTNYCCIRTYGTSVLLPLTPANNYDPRVIIMGGNNPATNTTEIIDMGASNPAWVYGPPMSQARIEMNAVILPNGKVLAVGGSVNDEDTGSLSLNADVYDPGSNTFSSAGANATERLYHSNALLLPDATVWLAGGNPGRGVYNNTVEIYQPAYLFNPDGSLATRPSITAAPSSITYANNFSVTTPDAANISSVVLVRNGTVTHAFGMDQREVGLSFTAANGTLTVTAPPNGNIAPPGYYMLFLLNSSGVPSLASFVLLANQIPPVPTNLVATAGNAQVGLSWSASSGATSYNVKRSTTSGGPYTTIASPTTNSYTDTGVTNGTTYCYVVSAVNAAGESANSSQVSATPQLVVPPPPTNLVATAGNAQVGLSWSASLGATSYNVKRSTTSGGPYTKIASPTTTSYTDTGVTNGTTYYYVVSAVNTAGESANSSQVSATPQVGIFPPPTLKNSVGDYVASSGTDFPLDAFSTTTTNPSTILVFCGVPAAGTTIKVPTDDIGNTYVDSGQGQVAVMGSSAYVRAFVANNITARANNVVHCHTSATTSGVIGFAHEFTGLDTSSPVDVGTKQANGTGGAAGANALVFPSASTTSDGDLIVAWEANNIGTPSHGTSPINFTDLNNSDSGTEYTIQTTHGSTAPTFGDTASSDTWGGIWLALARPRVASPPTGLVATAGNAQVGLSWNASSGATSYNVKRSTTSGGPYTTIASPTTTSYTDTGVTNGTTYYYVVSALNTAGESANSSQVSATPQAVPPPPTGLVATAGNAQVGLSWNASSGATSYNVKRSTTSGGPYTTIASPTTTSYTDTGVTNGTTYYYVVSAVNTAGESANSSQVSATPQPVVPPPPTGLVATAGNAQVGLSWNASSGATSYNVKRSTTSGGPYTTIASPTTTSYTDTGVTNGTTYYYVVSAVNTAGESANSSQVSATPQPVVPPPPTGLVATAGNGQVGLSWSASLGATSYNVKRATTSGGPYTTIASPTTTSYTDTGVTNGTTYYYVVSALNTAGESANSSQVSATPQVPVPPPPTGLVATAGNAQVGLSWNASSGATSYNVKRSTTSGGPYTTIASPTTTSYTDTGVTNGTTYYYVVSALNTAGESANSSQVSATPQVPVPPPPTGLVATAGNAQVGLSWNASSGATSYNVKRSTTSGGPYTTIASPTTTSYTDTGVTNGTTYYYVVSAVNTAGQSANSSQVSATPQVPVPPPPTGLVATAGNAQVGLSWNASSGATSYNVKRSTTSGGPYTTIASPTTTSYTDTGVTNGTTYYYVVSAVNTAGQSANSSQVSATPQVPVPPPPTGLVATAGNAQVGLSWNASSGATSYNVKRATTSGGPYTTIASPTTTSYTDTGVTNGTTYYYVVSAVNTAGESANSSQVSATPQPVVPPPPTGLVATAGNAQVGLSWNASLGATSYNVKRATTSGGPYTTIASPTTTSYTDTGVTNGTTYYYVVSAVNTAGESANSSQVSATPQPPSAWVKRNAVGTFIAASGKDFPANAFSVALTNPSLIIATCFYPAGVTPAKPTDTATNNYVDSGQGSTTVGSSSVAQTWYALNTHTTASNIVHCKSAGTTSGVIAFAYEWTGNATSSPVDGGNKTGTTTGGAAGANSLVLASGSTTADGDLIVAFEGNDGTPSHGTSPINFTDLNNADSGTEYYIQPTHGSIAPTFGDDTSSDSWGGLWIAFKHQ